MKYDPFKHHRRSIRLKDYDYSQAGAYFITLVAQNRECLFGEIVDGEMRLNDIGCVALDCWNTIPTHHANIELDEFVIMPNHVHGIIVIADNAHQRRGVPGKGVQLNAPTSTGAKRTRDADNRMSIISPYHDTLSVVIRTFKAAVTTATRQMDRYDFAWQRNYHEHIIRTEKELDKIRAYIGGNAARWAEDENNPALLRGSR